MHCVTYRNLPYPAGMARPANISDFAIWKAREALVARNAGASGLAVRAELKRLYGASGGTDRVYRVLEGPPPLPPASPPQNKALAEVERTSQALAADLAAANRKIKQLQEELQQASAARDLANERSDGAQDYWARLYDQRKQEFEQMAARLREQAKPAVSPDQYLRVCQRAAELSKRLSQYELVESISSCLTGK